MFETWFLVLFLAGDPIATRRGNFHSYEACEGFLKSLPLLAGSKVADQVDAKCVRREAGVRPRGEGHWLTSR